MCNFPQIGVLTYGRRDYCMQMCMSKSQNDDVSASRHADVIVENTRWHREHVYVEHTRLCHVDVSSVDLTRRWPLVA